MLDEHVQRAMQKWPNVPALAGWLKLDTQGRWVLIDPNHIHAEHVITHNKTCAFIGQNYLSDSGGRFFFQNGPQRVYVNLELTPWVYRLYAVSSGDWLLATHTGLVVQPSGVYCDEQGRVYFDSSLGLGLLHRADVSIFAEKLQDNTSTPVLNVSWVLAIESETTLPLLKQGNLKSPMNLAANRMSLSLPMLSILSDNLSSQFNFIPRPKVDQ